MRRLAFTCLAVGLFAVALIAASSPASETRVELLGSAHDTHRPSFCTRSARHPHFTSYPALHGELVPKKPNTLRLCRYHGLNGSRPLELAGTFSFPTEQARDLARFLDAVKPPPPGTYSCPMSRGRYLVARFGYPKRPDAIVRVDRDGCRELTNGSFTEIALSKTGARAIRQIRMLTEIGGPVVSPPGT